LTGAPAASIAVIAATSPRLAASFIVSACAIAEASESRRAIAIHEVRISDLPGNRRYNRAVRKPSRLLLLPSAGHRVNLRPVRQALEELQLPQLSLLAELVVAVLAAAFQIKMKVAGVGGVCTGTEHRRE
jgi:ABC-type uncharacterized transport system auxiliary subunit